MLPSAPSKPLALVRLVQALCSFTLAPAFARKSFIHRFGVVPCQNLSEEKSILHKRTSDAEQAVDLLKSDKVSIHSLHIRSECLRANSITNLCETIPMPIACF